MVGHWDPMGLDGWSLVPTPTLEVKPTDPQSVYAATKLNQEHLCLLLGKAYGVPTTVLRLFNVYGPRQDLSNGYTGVLAMFADKILSGEAPVVYEDGWQTRDFVHVYDVVSAFAKAIHSKAHNQVINAASGKSVSVFDAAKALCERLNPDITPTVTNTHRSGDIRHCQAGLSKAVMLLGYVPDIKFQDGVADFVNWLKEVEDDR